MVKMAVRIEQPDRLQMIRFNKGLEFLLFMGVKTGRIDDYTIQRFVP